MWIRKQTFVLIEAVEGEEGGPKRTAQARGDQKRRGTGMQGQMAQRGAKEREHKTGTARSETRHPSRFRHTLKKRNKRSTVFQDTKAVRMQ